MSAYVVGKRYRVLCAWGEWYGVKRWWPVIGPMHDDREIIGFPHHHYHIDARFVPAAVLRHLPRWARGDVCAAARRWPLHLHSGIRDFHPADKPETRRRRLTCRRQYQPFDYPKLAPWYGELCARYVHARMRNGICPHRGADLSTFPVDEDGCVQCPLHGLRWHVETGRMMPPLPHTYSDRGFVPHQPGAQA